MSVHSLTPPDLHRIHTVSVLRISRFPQLTTGQAINNNACRVHLRQSRPLTAGEHAQGEGHILSELPTPVASHPGQTVDMQAMRGTIPPPACAVVSTYTVSGQGTVDTQAPGRTVDMWAINERTNQTNHRNHRIAAVPRMTSQESSYAGASRGPMDWPGQTGSLEGTQSMTSTREPARKRRRLVGWLVGLVGWFGLVSQFVDLEADAAGDDACRRQASRYDDHNSVMKPPCWLRLCKKHPDFDKGIKRYRADAALGFELKDSSSNMLLVP
ncbi:hypothetical protein F5887DRAFT_924101 [Amanita rubescens]|nr:hypothetical protein F5887DRAFT_924101 [Amanita rubescens]